MNFDYDKLLDRAHAKMPDQLKQQTRFEIPKVDVFFEGNKTILRNFQAIAKTFRRKEDHFQKFLTKDLGAYSNLVGDRLIFNKKVFGDKIGDAVKKYAAQYVLCNECGKPDTYTTTLEGVKILKCEACGGWRPLK